MKVFLDSSVLLAACRSATGASRYVLETSVGPGWELLISPSVANEVTRNLEGRPESWRAFWENTRPQLASVEDILTLEMPVIFAAAKDRPVLFSAYCFADVLLTLDRGDFGALLGGHFYGLRVWKPADFLMEQRRLGLI